MKTTSLMSLFLTKAASDSSLMTKNGVSPNSGLIYNVYIILLCRVKVKTAACHCL